MRIHLNHLLTALAGTVLSGSCAGADLRMDAQISAFHMARVWLQMQEPGDWFRNISAKACGPVHLLVETACKSEVGGQLSCTKQIIGIENKSNGVNRVISYAHQDKRDELPFVFGIACVGGRQSPNVILLLRKIGHSAEWQDVFSATGSYLGSMGMWREVQHSSVKRRRLARGMQDELQNQLSHTQASGDVLLISRQP